LQEQAGDIYSSFSYLLYSSKCLAYCKHIIHDGWMDEWREQKIELYRQNHTPSLQIPPNFLKVGMT